MQRVHVLLLSPPEFYQTLVGGGGEEGVFHLTLASQARTQDSIHSPLGRCDSEQGAKTEEKNDW